MIVGAFGVLGCGMTLFGVMRSQEMPLRDDFGSLPLNLAPCYDISKLESYSSGKNPFRVDSMYVLGCWLKGQCKDGLKVRCSICVGCKERFQRRVTDFV